MHARKGNSGFTLLELIIVMLLMSLIAGIAVVVFAGRLPSARFGATARELSAAIRQARSLSQITGEKQRLTLNLDAGSYGIAGRGEKTLPPDIRIKIVDPAQGDLLGGRHDIFFYPAGNADSATILLWNDKKTAQISIDPVADSLTVK